MDLNEKPMITVLNKVDAIGQPIEELEQPDDPDTILVSARTGFGLADLRRRIEEKINEGAPRVAAVVPYDRTDLVDLFHRRGQPDRIAYGPEGTEIEGRLPARFVERFRPYLVSRDPSNATEPRRASGR
jgi:GTP-binding protein HflX